MADAVRPVRIAVLDDHEVLLDTLASWILVNAPDFEVVLSASTWLQLVHSPNFPPDLVILDFQLREPVSIEARVRTCRAAGAKVIVLSSVDGPDARHRALNAGAARFLSKTVSMSEVMDAARSVMGIAQDPPPGRTSRPGPVGSTPRPRLSASEEEALSLYASGLTAKQVAERMNVQYETVKTYLRRVREKYVKVGRPAGKRAELIRRAAEDGYLS